MADPEVLRGTYEDGVIRLERELPDLQGMRLTVRIQRPDGEGQPLTAHVDVRYPGPLVELGSNLAPMAQGPEPLLPPHIREFRQKLLEATGFPLPPVRLVVRPAVLGPATYKIYLDARLAGQGEVRMTRLLAVAASEQDRRELDAVAGLPHQDPIFDLPAKWILVQLEDAARLRGLTVVSPAQAVASHLGQAVVDRLPELMTLELAHGMLEAARAESPRLVEELVPRRLSEEEFRRLLQELLRRRRKIDPLSHVIDLATAERERDPASLAAVIGQKMSEFGTI